MSEAPRYSTLRDYLRVLREQRLLILLVTLVFVGSAYLLTTREEKLYESEAALSFRDSTRDFQLIGVTAGDSSLTSDQRSAIKADMVQGRAVSRRVRKALKLRMSTKALRDKVTARVEARTNLVIVSVRTEDPVEAARIANEYARQGVAAERRAQQRRFRKAAASLRRRFQQAKRIQRTGNEFVRAMAEERIASVEALSDFAVPALIVRRAQVQRSAVAPKPIRNTVLGALLGLTIGIFLAFGRDALNVRVRGARDVQTHVGLPLLGQVSDDALGASLVAANGRNLLSQSDLESFHILRANLSFLDSDHPLRTVAVTSALAEEGKSTVAAALAYSAALVGRRVMLIECDTRRPGLAGRLGLRHSPGLVEYLAGAAGTGEVIQAVRADQFAAGGSDGPHTADSIPTLHCIVAGAGGAHAAELVGSAALRDFLGVVARSYDLVVLDCAPLLPVVDALELIPVVDAVLLCVRSSRTTRDQARAARDALHRLPTRPTGVVITGFRPEGGADYAYYGGDYVSEQAAPPAARRA